jgi:arginyl-tRNA synthetase
MWDILRFIDGDPDKLKTIPETKRPTFLSQKYLEGSTAYEEDASAKKEIEDLSQQSFVLDDPIFKTVYEICNSWSFEYFDRIFQSIGSRPVEKRYLERDADNAGRGIVESNIGPVFTKSDGAVIFEGEKYGLHTRVFISSRGLTLYEARDLGLMKLKAEDFNPQASYIVTANEQKEYFEVILKAAELIMPEVAKMTRNISTGMVKLSTGKMSSRTGNAINIGWLIEAIKSALSSRKSSHEGQEQTIVGALRYSMLKNRIGSDLVFDVNDAISLEGNSGPYLQYAYARSRSILAKVTSESQELPGDIDKDERRLLRKLGDYQNVLDKAVSELLPHQLCGYLYELAQLFNQFYEHNRVLGDERENIRVNLVRKYSDILKSGLDVLGIPAPDRI